MRITPGWRLQDIQHRLEFDDSTNEFDSTEAAKRLASDPANEQVLWIEFVPSKRDVRDSVVQIRNHNFKSEMLIQSETAVNAGEAENY